MSPLVCPTPGADCPLYEQRLVFRREEALRLAILAEGRPGPDLAALVRAESVRASRPQALLPPAPTPEPVPLPSHLSHLTKEAP